MSRIGKQPITVPASVSVSISGRTVTVEASGKRLSFEHRPEVSVTFNSDEKQIVVDRANDEKTSKSYHGLTRALIANMVLGVTDGFSKQLEINGVGWNAQVQGKKINLNVGFADTRVLDVPMELDVQVDGNRITVAGADKQKVGEFAARIRAVKPPEPYNLKGIKYTDEVIIRKEGKAFAAGAA